MTSRGTQGWRAVRLPPRLTSPPPCAGSSGPPRSGRWCPSARTCPPERPGAARRLRALWERQDGTRPGPSEQGAGGSRKWGIWASLRVGHRGAKASRGSRRSGQDRPGLTLAKEGVFGQVPEGRLHHLEVPTAQAAHKCGQEVRCKAEKARTQAGPFPRPTPSGGRARLELALWGGRDLGLTWGCSGWSAGPGQRPDFGRAPQQSSSGAAGWSAGEGVILGLLLGAQPPGPQTS